MITRVRPLNFASYYAAKYSQKYPGEECSPLEFTCCQITVMSTIPVSSLGREFHSTTHWPDVN